MLFLFSSNEFDQKISSTNSVPLEKSTQEKFEEIRRTMQEKHKKRMAAFESMREDMPEIKKPTDWGPHIQNLERIVDSQQQEFAGVKEHYVSRVKKLKGRLHEANAQLEMQRQRFLELQEKDAMLEERLTLQDKRHKAFALEQSEKDEAFEQMFLEIREQIRKDSRTIALQEKLIQELKASLQQEIEARKASEVNAINANFRMSDERPIRQAIETRNAASSPYDRILMDDVALSPTNPQNQTQPDLYDRTPALIPAASTPTQPRTPEMSPLARAWIESEYITPPRSFKINSPVSSISPRSKSPCELDRVIRIHLPQNWWNSNLSSDVLATIHVQARYLHSYNEIRERWKQYAEEVNEQSIKNVNDLNASQIELIRRTIIEKEPNYYLRNVRLGLPTRDQVRATLLEEYNLNVALLVIDAVFRSYVAEIKTHSVDFASPRFKMGHLPPSPRAASPKYKANHLAPGKIKLSPNTRYKVLRKTSAVTPTTPTRGDQKPSSIADPTLSPINKLAARMQNLTQQCAANAFEKPKEPGPRSPIAQKPLFAQGADSWLELTHNNANRTQVIAHLESMENRFKACEQSLAETKKNREKATANLERTTHQSFSVQKQPKGLEVPIINMTHMTNNNPQKQQPKSHSLSPIRRSQGSHNLPGQNPPYHH